VGPWLHCILILWAHIYGSQAQLSNLCCFPHDWLLVVDNMMQRCTLITNGLVEKLECHFPTQEIMNAIGVIYFDNFYMYVTICLLGFFLFHICAWHLCILIICLNFVCNLTHSCFFYYNG
jgi:hypothetical protein